MENWYSRPASESLDSGEHMGVAREEIDAFSATVEENRLLRAENRRLMAELDEATSQALSTAHEYGEVSDIDIREEYTRLCSAIDAWVLRVTMTFGRPEFGRICKAHSKRRSGRPKESSGKIPDALSSIPEGLSIDELTESDNFSGFVLSWEIMRWLFEKVFKGPYPIGVTPEQGDLLLLLEESMNSLQNDSSAAAKWRSKTIHALAAHQSFEEYKEACTEQILTDGIEAISIWLPKDTFPNRDKFRKYFLDPALRLQQTMSTSTTRYKLLRSVGQSSSEELDLGSTFRDLATWGNVQNAECIQSNFGVLYPALGRLDAQGRVEEVLTGALFVVTLGPPILRGKYAPQRTYSATSPHDEMNEEHERRFMDTGAVIARTESSKNISKRSHDNATVRAKVRPEQTWSRKQTYDGRNQNKVLSSTIESNGGIASQTGGWLFGFWKRER